MSAAYSYRPNLARPLETFAVDSAGLHTPAGITPLTDITLLRLYTVPGASSLTGTLAARSPAASSAAAKAGRSL